MIKIFIFDLDGTLVNSLRDLADCVNLGLRAADLEPQPIEKYKKFVGNGREKMIMRAMGSYSSDAHKFSVIEKTFNGEYSKRCTDNTVAYEGCPQLLSELEKRGILTAVLSNKPDEFVERILKKTYPNHSFAEAWGKKPDFPAKPDGTAVKEILKLRNINPDECIYAGDSNVDIFTAINAGVKPVGVSWGFREREELIKAGAEFVADNPAELLQLLERK